MELVEVLSRRRSCRRFSTKRVSDKDIKEIEWSAHKAPYASGGPRRVVHVVREQSTKSKIMSVAQRASWVGGADTIFVVCGTGLDDRLLVSGHSRYVFDVGAATMCMDLMAVSKGLGTCWIGTFEYKRVMKILGIAERPVILLLVGYRNDKGHEGEIPKS